jgi:hypothetical protein
MRFSPRLRAILQAVFVTFLWSTSWVLIKRTISEIPPHMASLGWLSQRSVSCW